MKYLKSLIFVCGALLTHYAAAADQSAQAYYEAQGQAVSCKKDVPTLPQGACAVGYFGTTQSDGKIDIKAQNNDPKTAIFYRVWLSKSSDTQGVFQDFHLSGAKRTDPFVAQLGDAIMTNGNLIAVGNNAQIIGPLVVWRENQSKAMTINFGKNGVQGKLTRWYPNGQMQMSDEYNASVNNGTSERWYENGKPQSKSHTEFGVKDGQSTQWFDNGTKSIEGAYKDGLMQGKWLKWYPNGQLGESRNYENNIRVGKWQLWYPNGQLKYQGQYAAGKMDGMWTSWFASGAKAAEFEYKNSSLLNKKLWAEDGSVMDEK